METKVITKEVVKTVEETEVHLEDGDIIKYGSHWVIKVIDGSMYVCNDTYDNWKIYEFRDGSTGWINTSDKSTLYRGDLTHSEVVIMEV